VSAQGYHAACASQGFATPDGRVGGAFVQPEEALLAGAARHEAGLRPFLDAFLDGWIPTTRPRPPP
jgi:hypothetical protein